MSDRQNHQTLVRDYKSRAQFIKKLGASGGMMQFSVIVVISSWKHAGMPYYEFACPVLLCWAIYSFVKDFLIFLRVEKDVAQIIVDGVALEKRNITFGRFFHEVLDDFNLVKVLSIRSSVNLIAFGCFGYFLCQFIADLNPHLTISHTVLALGTAILTALAGTLYYDSLKSLVGASNQMVK